MAEGLNARVFPGEHLMLSVVLDIFPPPREEYKKAGSGYK